MGPDPLPYRILHLTAGSDAGGVSRYLFDLCTAIQARGHEPVIAGERGAWHWLFEKADWPWIDLPLKGHLWTLGRAANDLRRHLAANPVDLIHCHYRKAALVGRWATRSNHAPILFTLHLTGIPMHGVWRWLSFFGDHTHAACDEARQWLIDEARVTPSRITVIPHGVDPQRFPITTQGQQTEARRQLGVPIEAITAGYVGRLDDPKNVHWLIDLARAGRDRLPKMSLLIAGQGPHESDLRQQIQRHQLSDRVYILGHRDPLEVYQAIDALLLPSSLEGFSLVCAEAMSVGRPVLRTRTAGTSQQIIEGVTGRSVPIDKSAFIEAAIRFLSDDTALKAMGQAAARHVREHLTFNRQVEQTLMLYRHMIESRPTRQTGSRP